MAEYYSPQDIADRLGVSVYTIRRYIRAGKLDALRLDGGYRIGRDDLQAFLHHRRIGDASDDAPSHDDASS